MKCSLCNSNITSNFIANNKEYFRCNTCYAISMNPSYFVSTEEEITRYKTHNNNVEDLGYQNFVSPIVNAVREYFRPTHLGLDFGCGTGPVISKLLRETSFKITTYDPLFNIHPHAIDSTYDYIACCEVIEHFHKPLKEFQLLKSLLKTNGKLFCMTHLYDDTTNFDKWYYKDDETHVIFYHKKTCDWIASNLNFSDVTVENRLISFSL